MARNSLSSALGFLALVSGLLPVAPAAAFCRLTTNEPAPGDVCVESGVGLAWRRQCISYSVSQREASQPSFEAIRDAVDRSFAAWPVVECNGEPLPLMVRQTEQLGACLQPEYNLQDANANTITFLEDWSGPEFPPEAFGLTLVWHDPNDGEIFDADMQINETIEPLTICSGDCPFRSVDIENVVTHEAGHFLGLGHSQVSGSTMSARAQLSETSKRTLEPDDEAGICSIYEDYGAPVCEASDYTPDNGFSPECGDGSVTRTTTTCACQAPGARPGLPWSGASAAASSALVLLVLAYRRRGLRVATSSSTPSPTSK